MVRVLGNYSKLRGADMYVMKFNKNCDSFMNSKPCAKCECFLQKCMDKYGMKNVYYTGGMEPEGPFGTLQN